MKHLFYSAMIGVSALAFSAGAMAQSEAAYENVPQAGSEAMVDNNRATGYNDSRAPAETSHSAADAAAQAPEADVQLSQADITDTQRALRDEGFSVSVDGVWGPMTANAIAQFQQQNELPVTGQPDSQTLAALNVEMGAGANR